MPPRICTSCPLPHETRDWYVIEQYHPQAGDIECKAAHERRIPLEVRDFGTGRPTYLVKQHLTKPDLLKLLAAAG